MKNSGSNVPMGGWRQFTKRVIAIKVDATKVFSDLLTLLGYFAIASYLGGLSYINTYFKSFGTLSNLSIDPSYILIVFIKNILLDSYLNILLALIFLIIFGMAYFCSKYVWRSWFGYLILCILFGGSMMLSIGLGNAIGYNQAEEDWKTTSKLPMITITYTSDCSIDSIDKGRNLRLLQEDKNYVYIFEPKSDSGSDNYVKIIPKSCIKIMQVRPRLK